MENTNENGGQITVVNIKYGRVLNSKIKERPDVAVLDLPENIIEMEKKDKSKFEDLVETFAYNTVTRKYGAEVEKCQVFL